MRAVEEQSSSSLLSPEQTSPGFEPEPLVQIRRLLNNSHESIRSPGARHGPFVVVGPAGQGKSTLLSQIFAQLEQWNADYEVTYRIVRNCGQNPTTTYASELLRSICQEISLVYELEMFNVSWELGSLSNWLQEIIKLVEAIAESNLVIILDDIQNLRSVQTSSLLGWLPWSLPSNVHLIFSVDANAESVLSILKSRIPADNFVTLPGLPTATAATNLIAAKLQEAKRTLTNGQWAKLREHIDTIYERRGSLTPLYADLLCSSVVCRWPSTFEPDIDYKLPANVQTIVDNVINDLTSRFDMNLINKLCLYLTYTRYGLHEAELLDLVGSELPESQSATTTWDAIKEVLAPLLKEHYVLDRPYITWAHDTIGHAIKVRNGLKNCRAIHAELATAFCAGFTELLKMDEAKLFSDSCAANLLREMDELWWQLLHSGDIIKLKATVLFNADFLITAVRIATISYLRSILELVRGSILDYEIELLYTMTKHSISVCSADPEQLATEILMWLRPFSMGYAAANVMTTSGIAANGDGLSPSVQSPSEFASVISAMPKSEVFAKTLFIDKLLLDTRMYSLNKTRPFLIPTNAWLSLPIASQLAAITCPWNTISRSVLTKDNQNLIACQGKSIHVFNLPSRSTINTFEGHRSNTTCLHLSENGNYLATGSEDCSVAIWELNLSDNCDLKLKHRITSHSASVLCVTFTRSGQYVISGSELGVVCVNSLKSGKLVKQLDNHRGMVTCIKVNKGDDVFATASTDCAIIIWSREQLTALNTIFLPKPIYHMDISSDSTFLMAACQDNRVHVRALTTGSEVHLLEKHPNNAVVSFLNFAEDSCRAVVGCGDGKVYIYDVHSAKLTATLGAHSEMIVSIITTPSDRFLLTAGGNKVIVWNFSQKLRTHASSDSISSVSSGNKENVGANTSSSCTVQQSSSGTSNTSYQQFSRPPSKRPRVKVDNHREPITCVAVSRDGSQAVTGSRDSVVKIWTLATGDTQTTLTGHTGPITCVAYAPNGNFCVSGSDDSTVRVWGLKLGLIVSAYREHQSKLIALAVSNDSKKILSCDQNGHHRLWIADTGVNLMVTQKPTAGISLNANHVFFIAGKNENKNKNENMVRYYSIYEPEAEKSVSHSDTITCYTVTYDGQTIVTGSADMSLKVWEVASAKITQVLVQHEGPIVCVGTAALAPSLVISGSQDHDAIIWDMTTGAAMFTLSGHTATVIQVKLTLDGSLAITGGEDNVLMLWSAKGERIAMLDIHHSFTMLTSSLNANQLTLQLVNNQIVPIINLHNNPARDKTIELPAGTPGAQAADSDKPFPAWRGIIPGVAKKPGLFGRTLRREQSFDSFYFDQLNRGVSVDDFRKLSALTGSPAGSREHLPTTGIIWDGGSDSKGAGGGSVGPITAAPAGLISRAMPRSFKPSFAPKSKMLKKQQSMLAFFPEHGPALAGSMSSLAVRSQCPFTGGNVTTSTVSSTIPPLSSAASSGSIKPGEVAMPLYEQKKRSLQEQRVRSGLPSRSQSLEEQDANNVTGSAPVSPSKLTTAGTSAGGSTSKLAQPSATESQERKVEVIHNSAACVLS